MKKILFATTALVATASVAAADVTFSGYGRFGVMYTGSTTPTAAATAENATAIAVREALANAVLEREAITTIAALKATIEAGNGGLVDGYLAAADRGTERTITTAYDVLDYYSANNAKALDVFNQVQTLSTNNTGTSAIAAPVYRLNTATGEVALLDSAAAGFVAAPTGSVDIDPADVDGNGTTLAELAAQAGVDQTEWDALLAALPPVPDVEGTASDMMITSRLRLNIDASAESDSGVTFGVRVRIQQGEGEEGTANAARFYAKTGGLEVGVGNIYGALEWMAGQYPIDLGLTGLGYEYTAYGVGGADAYSSGGTGASGRNGVEVMYSAGDFSAHISASDAADAASSDRVAANVAYTMSDWTVALGVQDSDTATDVDWTATVGGKIGGVSLGLGYAETNAGVDRTVMTVGMDVGAATNVEAYIADQSDRPDTGYGVDFNHSLGGGTSLRGGVASLTTGQTIADFGVRFNF